MLEDVQNQKDTRQIEIDQVGITDLEYPIIVEDKYNDFQSTIAKIQMSVNLPHHYRGTHMSRFIEILNRFRGHLSLENIYSLLDEMEKIFDAQRSFFKAEFPYFIEKTAPVSGLKSLMNYRGIFIGEKYKNGEPCFKLGAKVAITTLCPCSKEISDYGAHNQRSIVTIYIKYKELVWLEDLITLVEEQASCEIFPLLKRPDEKFVTEKAYDNPKFVEDIVRSVAKKLKDDSNITWFEIESKHFESIHNHNVYAIVKSHNI